MAEPKGILVTDFDGTISRRDFYDLVRERWPVAPENDPWERYRSGEITHFAALAEIFSRIRCSEAELLELVDSMDVFPDFAAAVQSLLERGWAVVVASAGCRWYIDYLLAKSGLNLTVHANPGTFDPDLGLRMTLPEKSDFFDPATGVDKAGIVRDAIRRSGRVAFAGDGRPDLEPALLVPAERRFARGWLAAALADRKEGFTRFSSWSGIADTLPF